MIDITTDMYEGIGNKAKFLIQMKNDGFNVPELFVLNTQVYNYILDFNGKRQYISNKLSQLSSDNIREISELLVSTFSTFIIPEDIIKDISRRIDYSKKYAVRSSGIQEDLDGLSFAGQYQSSLNVCGAEKVLKAVIDCYCSMFSETNLTYLIDNNVDLTKLEMAVIIQEMIDSRISGVGFTINPITGNDKEIIVEVAEGYGENIVNGKVNPEKYIYNWFEKKYEYNKDNGLLKQEELTELMEILLKIQILFGYPCDIEFAFEGDKLYILQARPITRILYSSLSDQWTTANFKDGGVSATVCKPFMWSLYEYVWEIILKKFFIDTKMMRERELRKLGNMFYSRPYWNLGVVKEAMSKIPGYKEREFDRELGVTISYEGEGQFTKITPKSILRIIPVVLAQSKLTDKQNTEVESYRNKLLNKYNEYTKIYLDKDPFRNIESVWNKLIKDDYLEAECTYFWQIFINTIQQPLFKKSLPKCVDTSDYLDIISGLKNISHLMPYYDIWRISREIVSDKVSFDFWVNSDINEIEMYYSENKNEYFIEDLRTHIQKYGYHSEKELDVSYPSYSEQVGKVIKIIKDTILLDDSHNPLLDNERQYSNYCGQLEKLKQQVSPRKYKNLHKKIEKIRTMMWWREELKDISIRFYYLVRIFTVKLAEEYHQKGIIKDIDDIWYLKINDLFEFIQGKKDGTELTEIIQRNQNYYNSFRNFKSENEIGAVYDNSHKNNKNSNEIVGLGCNNGIVTGTARVIHDIEKIDLLQPGDILVTKFTDTGWTSKLAVLKGIVTECGGVLCHASIIAREYGIPCIVSCSEATKKIKDGSKITINGATGQVSLAE